MNNYAIRIEMKDGELKEILDKITEAQKTISECYYKLQDLGVVTITKSADKGSVDAPGKD